MPWAKLDDQFFFNRKVTQCDGYARSFHVAGIVYCSGQLTDGFVPKAAVTLVFGMTGFDFDKQMLEQVLEQLLDTGLWERCNGGYQIHDYLEYNPTREEAIATRDARAEAGRRGGKASAERREANAQANSQQMLKQNPTPSPSPSPSPDPNPNPEETAVAGQRKRRQSVPPAVAVMREEMQRYPLRATYQEIADAVGEDQAALDRWRDVCRQWARRGYNVGNVEGLLDAYNAGGLAPRKGNGNHADPPQVTLTGTDSGFAYGEIERILERQRAEEAATCKV